MKEVKRKKGGENGNQGSFSAINMKKKRKPKNITKIRVNGRESDGED